MASEKKKIWIISIIAVLCAVCLGVGIAFINISPYLKLKETVHVLMEDNYEYSMDYQITGVNMLFEKLQDGTIKGIKEGDILQGAVFVEETEYLEAYINSRRECLFNIKPIVDILLDTINLKSVLPLGALKDIYVSLEQIQEIIGKEQTTVQISTADKTVDWSSYDLKKIDIPKGIKAEYAQTMNFFEVQFENNPLQLLVGIPKKGEGTLYLKASQNQMILELYGEYQVGKVSKITMPKETVSDTVITVLKTMYGVLTGAKS